MREVVWGCGGRGGIPGDAMLIVHFQSSIKFNSHSAATCYSNSVSLGGSSEGGRAPPTVSSPSLRHLSSNTPSLLPITSRGCVNITDDPESVRACVCVSRGC